MLVDSNGKIVVAANGRAATLIRYNSDGTLDASFGTGGIVTLNSISLSSIAQQSNGKYVAGGASGDGAIIA